MQFINDAKTDPQKRNSFQKGLFEIFSKYPEYNEYLRMINFEGE